MRLGEVGEFGLIARLRELAGPPASGEVWAGDDTAVVRAPAGTILFTTDIMVEGVHFDLSLTGPEDLGYKAMAVNVSDVAAMGGTPRRAVAAIGVRPGIEMEWLERLYNGMRECAGEFDAAVVGGDVSRSECLVISVALIGNPAGRLVVLRNGARPGDAICVTGALGASAAGYRLLRAGIKDRPGLVQAHLRPKARVAEAVALRRQLPSAMIDISDGFAADLGHICEESGAGAVVDAAKLPVVSLDGVELDCDPLELALHGGEDYELCFTIAPGRAEAAAHAITEATSTPVAIVGEIVDGAEGMKLIVDGQTKDLEAKGWDHLKS
jgi:thiamine-monophosphate kinase